ncbi:hypothetical protein QTH87_04975 [Variovorax sp. J22P168]|uniref:hypothetical protein n=1 Tax=Variovorax jilinensis TaxID=3053513 RepID=UPI002574B12E|nr:hypothetical protein [Variovorax sp. J22P168]MDM0011786.1 hypothetical protein [Variovorax sp. J22P168]
MHFVAQRSLRSRSLLCVLAFALWMATTLGMVHRVLHVGAPATAAGGATVGALHADKPAAAHAHGIAALFGDHTEAECRLYDQLSHGSAAPCVPPVLMPVLLPAASFVWLEGEVFARWIALFDARGPPSTR